MKKYAIGLWFIWLFFSLHVCAQKSLEQFIQDLHSDTWGDRKIADDKIRDMGKKAKKALPQIVLAILQNKTSHYISSSLLDDIDKQWYKNVSIKKMLPKFINGLLSDNYSTREFARDSLPKIDRLWHQSSVAKKFLPQFIKVLDHANVSTGVKASIIKYLGQVKGKKNIPILLKFLDSWIKESAIEALGNARAIVAIPDLVLLLGDRKVVDKIVYALKKIQLSLQKNPQSKEKHLATIRKVILPLTKALGHSHPGVRSIAKKILFTIDKKWYQNPQVRKTIAGLIVDSTKIGLQKPFAKTTVRQSTIETLNLIDRNWTKSPEAKRTIPHLTRCLKSSKYISQRVIKTLHSLDPHWYKQHPEVTLYFIKLLANPYHGKSAKKNLDSINPLWHKSKQAITALPELVKTLLNTLKLSQAQWLLDTIDPKRHKEKSIIPALAQFLAHKSPSVRKFAKYNLEKIDPRWYKKEICKKSVPHLLKVLKSTSWHQRKAAYNALELIAPAKVKKKVSIVAVLGLISILLVIITIFSTSLYVLIKKGKLLIWPNIAQPILFCLLYIYIYSAMGSHHYETHKEPSFADWGQFTAAHILRAADIIDLIEEYNIPLQNIRHKSNLTGTIIVIMHLLVDIFLITALVKLMIKQLKKLFLTLQTILIILMVLFPFVYLINAFIQTWQGSKVYMSDLFFWWFLDNSLRTLDIGDIFQTFNLSLHRMEKDWVNASLAVIFRFFFAVQMGKTIEYYRVKWGGIGLTVDDLLEYVKHSKTSISIAAMERLKEVKAIEAIPYLIEVLADERLPVREKAMEVLEKVDPLWYKRKEVKKLVPFLKKASKAKQADVYRTISEALNKIQEV